MNLDNLIEETKAMEDAISPRTIDGHKIPMMFDDESTPQLLYPHFKRGPDGWRGMFFADEFADGKIPEDLEYLPGHEKPGKHFDCSNFDAVVYDDPVLNLPYSQQQILQAAQEISSLPVQPVVAAVHAIDEEDEDVVVSTPSGLFLQTPKGSIKLTNFGVWVSERRIIMKDNKEDYTELQLDIECQQRRYSMTIKTVEIDNMVRLLQQKYPECVVRANARFALPHISNYVRSELTGCPTKTVYTTPGFTKIRDTWVFVHDAAASIGRDILFQCNKKIGYMDGLSATTAFQQAIGILSLSPKLELILPLFLLIHLGPLFNLFRVADCTPRFVTFLAGTTGSLKTALTMCIYQLFEGLIDKPPANFYDTAAALEQKLGAAYSQVLLVDDFCPAITASNGKEKLSRLETVIRLVGDSISKSRSTPNQKLAKEFSPVGCCIVTGESTGGSRSTLLRCLVLPISRGDLNGNLLRRYQRQPQLLQTHLFHFLNWAGANGDSIVKYLQKHFPEEREAFTPCVREFRLVDTGAILMMTAHLILWYASDIGMLSAEQFSATSALWRNTLKQALQISECSTRELNPLAMYLSALMELRNSGKLPLASSQSSYIAADHVGYIVGDQWWLRPSTVFQEIIKYWKSCDRLFPLQDNDVRKLLAQHELIEVEHGSRDGQARVYYTKKTTLEGRPRMLVLRTDAAKAYLERELDEN